MHPSTPPNLPRLAALITKRIRGIINASKLRASAEVIDVIAESANEFVKLLTTQANLLSQNDHKATIAPPHVLTALDELQVPYISL